MRLYPVFSEYVIVFPSDRYSNITTLFLYITKRYSTYFLCDIATSS